MLKILKRLNITTAEDLSDVDVKYHTPEGLFTRKASGIVDGLLKDSKNDLGKAIKRINFYINRAGKDLSNKTEVMKAKKILEDRNEKGK